MPYNRALINTENILSATPENFERSALEVFRFQHDTNVIYRQYCDAIHIDADTVESIDKIPFLPISFYKSHKVVAAPAVDDTAQNAELVFESSGTTGENTSRHYVMDAAVYEASLLAGFRQFYGDPKEYALLALLPSYLERKNASLVHMARVLMAHGGHTDNGFYINEWTQLQQTIQRLEAAGQKIILLGVTFALLDFAEAYPMQLKHTIVMETGGMKGRKEEMTRRDVHAVFEQQWGLKEVHSEYGMTELLSQAYAQRDGLLRPTATMQVFVRDINDPLDVKAKGSGGLNLIDLANVNSCSFIATEDIGVIHEDGTFEVLGRMDHSILRGCSMMVV